MSGSILVTSFWNFANSPGEISIDYVDESIYASLIFDLESRILVEFNNTLETGSDQAFDVPETVSTYVFPVNPVASVPPKIILDGYNDGSFPKTNAYIYLGIFPLI